MQAVIQRRRRSHGIGGPRVSIGVHLPPFETLIEAHAQELFRFLAVSVGRDDAEDCLQETFMSALRAYPSLRHGDSLRAWLFTIAQRKATDAVRRRSRRPTRELDGHEPAVAGHEPGDDGLWAEVHALPPKQRAAVVHRFVFDLAYAEIADRMGITAEAARQNVHAGLRRLRAGASR
jgi:RNA polymerase sigma factor (sigma-70 family)